MTKTTFQLSTLSAAITSVLLADVAIAQQNPLEEVIVTATRRSESIQDIPINITALSSNMIERERLTNLSDIAKRVPGLVVVDQGPRSGNTLTVRGLTVDSIAALDGTNDGGGTVATYLGEIPLYADLTLSDLARVEVLIGPQGTLYGAGTLGGALRYIPNKPQADESSVSLRGDLYNLTESDTLGKDVGATINFPIVEDRLAVRASLDYEDDPGFIDYKYLVREPGVSLPQPDFSNPDDVRANLTRKNDANTVETLSGRLAMRYTDDRLDGTLTYYYQDTEIGARQINHRDAFGTGKYESGHRYLEPKDRKNQLLSLELIADLGFAELTSATGYSEYQDSGQRDQTDLLLTFEYGYETFPSFAAFTRDDLDEEIVTQELRLVSTGDGPLGWIVGGFYNERKSDSLSREFTPGFDQWAVDNLDGVSLRPDALEYYQSLEEEKEEVALFGELSYDINDAWQVTFGARWFSYKVDSVSGLALPLYNTVFEGAPQDSIDIDVQTSDTDDDDVIFKINTSYDFSDELMGYLTISEGYRNGGINSVSPCPEVLTPGVQNVCALPNEVFYGVDKTLNYEIGIHSEFSDKGRLNGAIYYLEWDDAQVAAVTKNGALPITSNTGAAESYGLELSGAYAISPELSISGSYSYNKSELTEVAPGVLKIDAIGDALDAEDGDRLPGSPEHALYLAANYSMELNSGAELDFDWSMTAQSSVLTKLGKRAASESLEGFSLHNVSATLRKDNYSVSLYANNVFNKYAETGVRSDTSNIRSVGDFQLRRYYHNVIRPRQVGLQFTYDLDM